MSKSAGNIRYSLRQFRQAPIFTIAAVLTLALGIGGTTAIFTLIHAVMIRSLPVADPASLYMIGDGTDCCVEGGPQDRWGMFSYPLYERLRDSVPEFSDVMAFQAGQGRLSVRRADTDDPAKPLRSQYVAGNYFQTLGIGSFAGRVFTPADDTPGSAPVAVLSHRVWQTTYASDPRVIGSTFFIEGHPFTIVGIAPAGFFGAHLVADPEEIWVPLHQEPAIAGGNSLLVQPVSAWLRIIARLKPGASTDGISARLTTLLRQWLPHDSGYPPNWLTNLDQMLAKQVINIVPAGGGVAELREQYSRDLEMLLAVCGLVLLIACANVANLLLARAVSRQSQTAIRIALGASRRQIITQALTESILLAIGGGIAGLLVAMAAGRLLLALAFPVSRYVPISVTPSLLVLGFAFALALITGMIFGAAPAWFATRTDPAEALRGTGRSTSDHSSFARKALLVVQATLSVVLVAGATMLARSLNNLEGQNFGFQTANRVIANFHNPVTNQTPAQLDSLYRQLEDRLDRIPGVEHAGLALYNPLTDNWGELIIVSGHPLPKMGENSGASWDRVSTDYLKDLGVPVLRGRGFTAADNETSEPVAVVNEAFVKQFFKNGENPLDQHFGMDVPANAGTFRIVGVVGNARFAGWGFRRPIFPMFYVPLGQTVNYKDSLVERVETASHYVGGMMLVTRLSPAQLEPLITQLLRDLDPDLTLLNVRTVQQRVELVFDQERSVAGLAGLFGIVALILAAIGLYGVTAYTVAQRTNEIGIRMALGAGRGRVLQLILFGAFRRVLIGLMIGLPLAVGAGKLISSQLYGVASWDPLALIVAAGALACAAFLAAIIPANRAASISPTQALRIQ